MCFEACMYCYGFVLCNNSLLIYCCDLQTTWAIIMWPLHVLKVALTCVYCVCGATAEPV